MRLRILITVVAALLLFLLAGRGLDRPFGNGDEVIHAQHVREMIASGEVATLRWQGHPVYQRPPLPYFVASLGARVSAEEWGMRLPSALAFVAILLLIGWIADRLWRRWDVTALTVLLCAGSATFDLFTRSLLSDPLYVLGLTVALAGALWARSDGRGYLVVGAGFGFAVACKSFAAAMPACGLAIPLVLALRKNRNLPAILGAIGIAAALALPYFISSWLLHGQAFIDGHFGYSLLARARGELRVGMDGGVLAYGRYLIDNEPPLVLAWLVVGLVVTPLVARRLGDPALGAVALCGAATLVVLSTVGTRLPHYLLPVFPAAALAAAGLYGHATTRWLALKRWPQRAVAPVLALSFMWAGWLEPPRSYLLDDPRVKALGRAAHGVTPPETPVFTWEWYAPAFGFYAERPLIMATASPQLQAIMADVDIFRNADVPRLVDQTFPAPAGSVITVAGPREALARVPGLAILRVIASEDALWVVRARVTGTLDGR